MHVLTKIFVFIAAILSVALAALTMTYAANADRIVGDYQNARLEASSAKTALQDRSRQLDSELTRRDQLIQELRNARSQLESEVSRLQGENVRLVADKRAAETSNATTLSRIGQLGETSKTQVTLIESYKDEVSDLRDNELVYRREKLELEDRINDLESQNEVLAQTTRALREQLNEMRVALQDGGFSEGGAGGTEVAAGFVRPGAPVRGEVLEVMQGVNGSMIARIDLGRNDDVRENMKLFVARGDSFLANMRIIETDTNTAIGELDPLGRNVQIRAGDSVISRLQ